MKSIFSKARNLTSKQILKGIENGAKDAALFLDGKLELRNANDLFCVHKATVIESKNKSRIKSEVTSNNQQLPTNN
ncbi:hypothetical protein QEG73_16190 [Chitinophagaceae bacterium 26-R-25]|nr:hypothetical protein [Chitinophagaceae bacterium 26-R-25]